MVAIASLATGCGTADAVMHGYHRYTVPSVSMEPTLHAGQVIDARPVDRGKYVPKRGDIVVFTMPSWSAGKNAPYLKRVVAVGGDKIACCTGGRLTLNRAPLAEPYLKPNTEEAEFGPLVVPPGRLWVMGDNRPFSADSRAHVHEAGGGTVPAAAVIGVVVMR